MMGRLCGDDCWHTMVCSALPMTKSLSKNSSQSHDQAKTKVVCLKYIKHCTAEPFHFLHMGPMSDVSMMGRLYVADCWHTMVCSALPLTKSLSKNSSVSHGQAKTKVVCLKFIKHCTAEPFHFLHMDPMSDVTMSGRLYVADY
jgi:hypothetical protein